MLQHDNKTSVRPDPGNVKQRIVKRFFEEHDLTQKIFIDDYPGYMPTATELAGLNARVAKFDEQCTITVMAEYLFELHDYLIYDFPSSPDTHKQEKVLRYLETLAAVIRLLDWMAAYGPTDYQDGRQKKE